MKKFIKILIGMTLASSLTACGTNAGSINSSEKTTAESKTESVDKNSDETKTSDENKILVVYYSATGSTEKVANNIASAVNGDLFAIEPTSPYTSDDLDWTNSQSRVSVEHDNPDQRNVELVTTDVENWNSYDTVFIGYPIWWGIAAWSVDNFVKENDFNDKTVIPFCTSASSGIGESGELLAEMAGTGNWLEGERFSSAVSEDDVTNWVKSLDLN
ncbi:MAG: flavodoxin [Oscillospiraceae bacterium]|nr:flavodoxin [Oscillospiraceae bacterium]